MGKRCVCACASVCFHPVSERGAAGAGGNGDLERQTDRQRLRGDPTPLGGLGAGAKGKE